MTVKFSVVPKKDPRDLNAPPKYYPTVVSKGHSDLRAIAERIAWMSTVGLSKKTTFFFLDSPKWEKKPNYGVNLIIIAHDNPSKWI